MDVEREFSCGGVVVRGSDCIVIVPTRRAVRGGQVLALPKGHPENGESPADAAVREVREEGAGERDVTINTTQADLAKLAGSSRESASRFLAVLERAGVISQGRGRITVHDPQALANYVY